MERGTYRVTIRAAQQTVASYSSIYYRIYTCIYACVYIFTLSSIYDNSDYLSNHLTSSFFAYYGRPLQILSPYIHTYIHTYIPPLPLRLRFLHLEIACPRRLGPSKPCPPPPRPPPLLPPPPWPLPCNHMAWQILYIGGRILYWRSGQGGRTLSWRVSWRWRRDIAGSARSSTASTGRNSLRIRRTPAASCISRSIASLNIHITVSSNIMNTNNRSHMRLISKYMYVCSNKWYFSPMGLEKSIISPVIPLLEFPGTRSIKMNQIRSWVYY